MAGPRWIKLDVDYFGNPKVLAAGRDGMLLHLASMAHCGRFLTDGWLTGDAVAEMARSLRLPIGRTVDRVVAAGLWLPVDDGWQLHDFTAMNGTRAQVEARIEATRKRKREWAARHEDDA
jgi:hypothetical protein